MTIKEIWTNFLKNTAESGKKAYDDIRKMLKSTFELLKTTLVDFVKGVFSWLESVLSGLAGILWELIKIVCNALYSAVKSTLGICLEKIIAWIGKL